MANYRIGAIVQGMFNNPNDLALCFVMLLPFVYYLFIGSSSIFKKIFLGICFIIFFLGTIFTYSRGGFIGLLAVLCFIFLRSKNKIKTAIGLSIIVLLFFSFTPPEYIERIKTIPIISKEDHAVISRLDAWKAGISMMRHRLFGVGLGNFGEGFVRYRPEGAVDLPGKRRVAHNAFIQIGGETGVLGLAVFTLLIVFALKELSKVGNRFKEISSFAQATWVSLVGFIVCAFFLSQAFNWILYYFIAFSVILKELSKRMESEETH